MRLGRLQEAKEILEPLTRAIPKSTLAHLDLGIIYSETRENDRGIKELKTAIALDPKNVNAHWRLARLYKTLGRKADASAEFEKAKHLNQEQQIDAVAFVLANGRKSEPVGGPNEGNRE